jgi:transposase
VNRDLLRYDLKTVRAYLLKEAFQQLWDYNSPAWAGKFLDELCRQTMRSRIDMLNYFRAQKKKKTISSGVVEGLNNKAKVTMRNPTAFAPAGSLNLPSITW